MNWRKVFFITLVIMPYLQSTVFVVFVTSASAISNYTKPIVHIVVLESTGALDRQATYYVRYLKALFEIVLQDAELKFGKFLDIRFKHIEALCGPSMVGALAAKEYYSGDVDVFIGPVCNGGVVPLAYMALAWNLPVISPRGNTAQIRNATIFPNIISLHPFDKYELVKFTVYLLKKYKWEHVSVLADRDNRLLATTGESYTDFLETSNLFWNFIPVYSSSFTDKNYDDKLMEASLSSRVFVLIMGLNDVRRVMLRAANLGMTQGDYVYIVPEFQGLASISSQVWRRNDSTDVKVRQAFRAVLFISVLRPPISAYDLLILRLNQHMFGNDSSKYLVASVGDEETDDGYTDKYTCQEDQLDPNCTDVQEDILEGYYNALMIYLEVVNETSQEGGNITGGLDIVRKICNRTFKGIAGTIHINSEGHRDTDMALVDMTDPWNGTFERVAIYKAELDQLLLFDGVTISWPGNGKPAEDFPDCGFNDILCGTYAHAQGVSNQLNFGFSRIPKADINSLAIGLSTSFALVFLVAVIAVAVMLRFKCIKRLKRLTWWKLDADDLQPLKRNLTKSTFSSTLRQSNTNAADTGLSSCTVCMYKGNLIRQHTFNKTDILVSAKLLKEFNDIRDMNHVNLLRVFGAVLEADKSILITEHCPKGSLQEVLMEETFKLDNVFSLSILTDIVRALTYIHKRSIKFHGRLTSEVCMIDARFSVKVGYYGLPTIYETVQLQSKAQSKEKAPEILRAESKGNQLGDIYSLAIIMSEVISREEPYSNDKEYLTTQEVLNKVRTCEEPPFRPAVNAPSDLVQLETLMKQCWDEAPEKRPSLYKIAAILHGLMTKFNKSGSLVDNLLQRLEKYSTNLEKIVDEKVNELRQEKHKSEELLRQMLPKIVAERLKAGLTVEPEQYECVTIYFSDIVGFTEMCSELKPVQIVNLLNDLYSCFDGIIGNYDVYKVETIGDGYMVVSGLPNRNGNEHALQIARMSLALLSVIAGFTPIETSEDRLMLRIGLHSGPVCAGVVGLKMPRYCLFGDTVNTASRMETNGMEWKIHMSSTTAEILKTYGNFVMKRRGEIEIKGKGTMETYWLLAEKDANSENTKAHDEDLALSGVDSSKPITASLTSLSQASISSNQPTTS